MVVFIQKQVSEAVREKQQLQATVSRLQSQNISLQQKSSRDTVSFFDVISPIVSLYNTTFSFLLECCVALHIIGDACLFNKHLV